MSNNICLFGIELKRLRIKHYYTQRELSRRMNIHKSTYNAWERGHRLPLPHNLKEIVKFYQASGEDMESLVTLYQGIKEGQ